MLAPLIPLLPNRVRRNYRGGYLLDQMENHPAPSDGDRPENWLASTVPAVNPGLAILPGEGFSTVRVPSLGEIRLQTLFQQAPAYYHGLHHISRVGPELGFLAKLLDSSMRLHVQAHPTASFARQHLCSRWGKLEAYVILALRDARTAHIRLGFQRPPSPGEWRRIVLAQDIAAMEACFDPVPVRVGEVWWVPGGLPHAIGAGVLMLEVMEPTDLVVRCEFEREGSVVPPEARFMQTDLDLAFQIFDFTPLSVAQVEAAYKIAPQRISSVEERLIGPAQTDCFSISRVTTLRPMPLDAPGYLRLGVVAAGHGTLTVEDCCLSLHPGTSFLIAAAASAGTLTVQGGEPLTLLFCSSGQPEEAVSRLPAP